MNGSSSSRDPDAVAAVMLFDALPVATGAAAEKLETLDALPLPTLHVI
jgi:hypothetical protein